MTIDLHRDRFRNRRKRAVRALTINVKRLTQQEIDTWRAESPVAEYWRPKTRGECLRGPRPCPYVACRWHLYLDVTRNGSIKFNFPDLEPHEMAVSCALDVADRGGCTLDRLSERFNVTRERIRQMEVTALSKLERAISLRKDEVL
jgi:hypothetical protein